MWPHAVTRVFSCGHDSRLGRDGGGVKQKPLPAVSRCSRRGHPLSSFPLQLQDSRGGLQPALGLWQWAPCFSPSPCQSSARGLWVSPLPWLMRLQASSHPPLAPALGFSPGQWGFSRAGLTRHHGQETWSGMSLGCEGGGEWLGAWGGICGAWGWQQGLGHQNTTVRHFYYWVWNPP